MTPAACVSSIGVHLLFLTLYASHCLAPTRSFLTLCLAATPRPPCRDKRVLAGIKRVGLLSGPINSRSLIGWNYRWSLELSVVDGTVGGQGGNW